MAVSDNQHQITTLSTDSTFFDWIQKENNELIGKLNLMKVYDGLSGDGINIVVGTTGASDGGPEGDVSSGVMRVSISDSIPKGITFQNDITIGGIVNYDFGKSETSATKIRIFGTKNDYHAFPGPSGWTGTGLTFGMPVRVGRTVPYNGATGGVTGDWIHQSGTGATMGVYKAQADSSCNAEVLGLVSGITTDYVEVVISGKLGHDNLFSDRFKVDSSPYTTTTAVTAGHVYFLHPGSSGDLSPSEPEISGEVSKPLFMGMGTTYGVVLGYRGQLLTSNTGDTGPGDTNKNIVDLGTSSHSDIDVGHVVGYNPEQTSFDDGRSVYNGGWFRCSSKDSTAHDAVGIVLKNVTNSIVEVQNSGYVTEFPGSINGGGLMFIGEDGTLTTTRPGGGGGDIAKPFAITWNHAGSDRGIIINQVGDGNPRPGEESGSFKSARASSPGGTGAGGVGENILINGGFDIWQRRIGKDSAYGYTGSTYFADRWVRVDGITSAGATASSSIQRMSFAANQTSVEGNPTYYIRANHGISGSSSDYIHIENRIEDVRTLNAEPVMFSFFAKAAVSGTTLGVLYTQNYSGDSTKQIISDIKPGGVEITGSWKRYTVSFQIPGLYDNAVHSASPSGQHYCAIGFNMTKADAVNVDIAQVKFERGLATTRFEPVNTTEELEKCSRYYQRSYGKDQANHSVTMLGECLPDTTVVDFIVPQTRDHYHRFPTVMRGDPTITFYSPKSGETGDAFNRTACKDVRLTSGTKGYGGNTRVSPVGRSSVDTTSNKHGVRISVGGGAVILDNISLHYVADADINDNL